MRRSATSNPSIRDIEAGADAVPLAVGLSSVATWLERHVPCQVHHCQSGRGPAATGTSGAPALVFALHGASADPRGVGVWVTFQLASSARATLQLADVAGRIIEALEVGTLGPGSHDVTLAARRLPAGLYMVRLRQDESSAARKAVVLR